MAIRAYVLIETQVGKTKEAIEGIRELEGVVQVDSVTGPYDAIATVEKATLSKIGGLVTERLQHICGVSRTVICLAVGSS